MFAYCGNNPITREDMEGNSWWDNVKKFGQGFADGFTSFFNDAVETAKNIPTIVKDAVEHPVDTLKAYAKSAFWGVIDPFGGRRKIYSAGKALFVGDAYALGHVVGKHTAESAVAIAAYGMQRGVESGIKALQTSGKLPKTVNINTLINNPDDAFVTVGPKEGQIAKYISEIGSTGRYELIYAKSLGNGYFQIANGHHRVAALRALGYTSVKVLLTE